MKDLMYLYNNQTQHPNTFNIPFFRNQIIQDFRTNLNPNRSQLLYVL
eukprot:UN01620